MSQATETPNIGILPGTAAALCEHPAVRDAVAYRRPASERVEASILANESYLDDVLGRKESASSQVSTWRKTYDLSQLSKAAAASPFASNFTGWNSSYTRRPLPPEDMQEWVQTTVDRISSLAPNDVLEIGCGTGLLLLRLASACQRYVGIDFAPSVLRRLREQLAQAKDFSHKVELLERSADNFDGFADDCFSTLIVNSVAQYFPSQAYLNRAIENATRVVRPGGHVFLGDLRNFVLLEARAASIEAFQAPPELSVSDLRTRVDKRLQQEQELVVSPTYCLSLQQRFSKVGRVEIFPRRGTRDNEMTRFRYDAILSIGPQTSVTQIPFLDPPANGWGANEIRSQLAPRNEKAIGFVRIPNSRVERDMRLLTQLATADPKQTIGELREQVDQAELQGIHPEELVRMAAETGHRVTLSWAGCHPDGSYDAAFVRQPSPEDSAFPAVKWPQPIPAAFVYYTNAPGQSEIRQKLVDELLSHCRSRLQEKAVPASLHLVDSFPRTAAGSVDCDALLSATSANCAR